MRYELMFPDQIRKAIKENLPVVMPVGVLEYHDEHNVVGVDTLLVVRAVEELEKEMDLVILPPFYYGAASYGVAVPENNGTVHVNADAIRVFAKQLFLGLLRVGFKNIHLFIHHQSENFYAGMPTDLALRMAAREVIFDLLEKERGEGWWGDKSMNDYYARHEEGTDPFNQIKVHPFMNAASQKKFPVGHADIQETSLMMAFCPEGVDMKRYTGKHWFGASAREANITYGNKAKRMILEGMRRALKG